MSVARIREIANRCNREFGIPVVWAKNWDRNGNGMSPNYSGIVDHHTATSYANYILSVLIYGRPDLSGPLCNFCTFANGTLGVVAAFPANHAGASGGYNTAPLPVTRSFNAHVIGNEIIYPGNEPMTAAQRRTAAILSGVAAEVCGHGDYNRIKAHAETSITGKWDPGYAPGKTIDMNKFRSDAKALVRSGGGGSTGGKKDMAGVLLTMEAGEHKKAYLPLAGLPPFLYTMIGHGGEVMIHTMDFVKVTNPNTRTGSYVPGARIANWKVLPDRPGPFNLTDEQKAGAVMISIDYSSDRDWEAFVG